jgi:signal transduction histidine kinase
MTSRWRIRHKLLFGLALVVCIMALLLCGTILGLYSYYATMVTLRAKFQEKIAAEKVKFAVADLIAPDHTWDFIRGKGMPLDSALKTVGQSVDAYLEKLDETVRLGRDPLNGEDEREKTDYLRESLDSFKAKIEERMQAPGAAGMANDEMKKEEDLKFVKNERDYLRQAAADLLNVIDVSIGLQMDKKSNYQVALWIVVPSAVFGLLLMAGLTRAFYSWVFNPIRDLEAGVARVAKGDFRHRIDLHSGDEMEDLANAFNNMLERLQALYDDLAHQVNERSRQLVRSERLASVGFLAAGVAHEINNPLASIAFCSEALDARLNELIRHLRVTGREGNTSAREEHDIFSKYLKMIQDEAFRCKTITERLLEFSRTGERKREPTDLRELVQAVLDVTQHLPNHKGKHITFEVPPERMGGRISAWVNGEEIKSVILNLVVNALESMDEGGRLTIRLAQRDGLAELRFIDTGCGMNQEVLENIFEPFFTRSRSGKGTGLGLTISHLIISQHGGEIEAASPGPGQGSTFIVRLPTQPTEPVAEVTIGETPAKGPRLAA